MSGVTPYSSCFADLYYALYLHLIYACQIWGLKETLVRKLLQLQNKAMRVIKFKLDDHPADDLYDSNKIVKITEYIKLLNCMFVKSILAKRLLNKLLRVFQISK